MKARRTWSDLFLLEALEKGRSKKFHNTVTTGNKKSRDSSFIEAAKFTNTWYLKHHLPYEDAVPEVVAQEVFRLFIPNQPKTRLIEPDADNDKFGVMSKQVDGYQSVSEGAYHRFAENTATGVYHGLGEVMVIALLVNETDLKFGNLGLDANGQIIKIDGDRCFADMMFDDDILCADISEMDLQMLPKLHTYRTYNWLDFLTYENDETVKEDQDAPICTTLADSALLRAEINKALLKVYLMPDTVVDQFVGEYVDEDKLRDQLYTEITKRKNTLCEAALQNQSFRQYVLSAKSNKDFREYLDYLAAFHTTSKNTLNIADEKGAMVARLAALKKDFKKQHVPATFFSGNKKEASAPVKLNSKKNNRQRGA